MLGPKGECMNDFFKEIKCRFTRKDNDFMAKVLIRYSSQRGISTFSSQLFKSENADTINARFEKTKQKATYN